MENLYNRCIKELNEINRNKEKYNKVIRQIRRMEQEYREGTIDYCWCERLPNGLSFLKGEKTIKIRKIDINMNNLRLIDEFNMLICPNY